MYPYRIPHCVFNVLYSLSPRWPAGAPPAPAASGWRGCGSEGGAGSCWARGPPEGARPRPFHSKWRWPPRGTGRRRRGRPLHYVLTIAPSIQLRRNGEAAVHHLNGPVGGDTVLPAVAGEAGGHGYLHRYPPHGGEPPPGVAGPNFKGIKAPLGPPPVLPTSLTARQLSKAPSSRLSPRGTEKPNRLE